MVWSRRHRDEAGLLLRGPREFAQADWPEATRREIHEQPREAQTALRTLADRLGGGAETLERVVLAAVDVPYATIRRRLLAGDPMSRRAEALVEECARTLVPRG